jgi:hypothetical protein
VLANGDSALGGTRTERVQTLATALESRPTATAIKLEASAPREGVPVSGSLSAQPNLKAGTMTLIADADNGSAAVALANSAGSYAVMLAGRVQAAANAPFSIPASDFSNGIGAWDGISKFTLRPTSLTTAPKGGPYGDGSLKVVCSSMPGCGPSARLNFAVVPRNTYTAVVWARASSRSVRATIFLGSNPKDVATGHTVVLAPIWRRLVVSWTASHPHSAIELGVLLISVSRTAGFLIGSASLTDGPAPPAEAQERRLIADAGAAVAVPARATGAATGNTALSAVLGAGAGLLAAVAGCVAGGVARRRQSGA